MIAMMNTKRTLSLMKIKTALTLSIILIATTIYCQCFSCTDAPEGTIFCDDFESGDPLSGRYFESGGNFILSDNIGRDGTKGMKAVWGKGAVGAGALKNLLEEHRIAILATMQFTPIRIMTKFTGVLMYVCNRGGKEEALISYPGP